MAGRIAAVLGQQHADVHLVGLRFEVLEEALDAIPLLVPVAVPVRRAVDDPVALAFGERRPGRVARDAGLAAVLEQVVLAFLPGRRLHRLDRSRAQRLAVIGDDQAVVDTDDAAEAAAGVAGAVGRVEAEQRRLRVGVAQVAVGAMQAGAEAPQIGLAFVLQRVDVDTAAAALERHLDRLDGSDLLGALQPEAIGHHIQQRARAGGRGHLALRLHAGEAAGRQPLFDVGLAGAGGQLDREGHHETRISLLRAGHQLRVDRLGRVVAHALRGLLVEQLGGTREQQLQVIVQLGHRADRRARAAHRVGLVDGDGRRHAVDAIDRRAVHALEELARIGAEGLDVAPLAFGVERVEHQAGLARAAGPGHHRHLAGADVEIEVLQVVLAGAADADRADGAVLAGLAAAVHGPPGRRESILGRQRGSCRASR